MALLEAQAALETAVVNAIRAATSATPPGLGYPTSQCNRMYDGQPPKVAGNVFVSVWAPSDRPNQGKRTSYEELHSVRITVTIRFTQPADKWVIHRDDCMARANAIAKLIGLDQRNYSIINAANTLAGYRSSGDQVTIAPAGWVEPLLFEGLGDVLNRAAEWWSAIVPAEKEGQAQGCSQEIRFGRAKRVQAVATAT